MAAHVLRLRLDLLLGALRGDARHVTRTVVGTVAFLALVAVVCVGILGLRDAPDDVARAVTVLGGAAVTLAFLVAPLAAGVADPLDPRRFAVFGADPLRFAGAILLASLISVPVLALAAIAVCLVILWDAHGAPTGVAVLAVVLGSAICILLGKLSLALAGLFRSRRPRELTGVFLVGVLVVVVPVVGFLASLQWRGRVPAAVEKAVDILAVTPLGAAFAVPPLAVDDAALAPLTVAGVTVLVLGALWLWLVRRLLTTTPRPRPTRVRGGLGWFALTPGTPAGAIAARSLTYWSRDARYIANVVIVPVAALITVVPLLLVGVPADIVALVPVPIMALFFGWLAHNDLAYDSTALWMHVAGAVRGAADRVGRLVPVSLVAVPLLAVAIPVAVRLHGTPEILPAMIGVCASLFLCGLGLSSISSAAAPYPVSRPGDSPFQQPQRTGGGLTQGLVLVGAVVLSAPAMWFAWLALTEDPTEARTALWAGTGVGAFVLIVGILLGGWIFERGSGRLMEFAESV